jgi:hypothetical protein
MKKLIQERIIKTEEQPFDDSDLAFIETRRNKQFAFLVYSYLPLALICIYILINGLSVISRKKKYPWIESDAADKQATTFQEVAPYVCGFFLLMLTIYFVRYYLESVAPLVKDAKQKKKLLLHFMPEKTDMSAFNRYFLSTPVFKKQQVEITKEDFYAIPNGIPLILEMAAHSNIVLRFTNNGKEIKVN